MKTLFQLLGIALLYLPRLLGAQQTGSDYIAKGLDKGRAHDFPSAVAFFTQALAAEPGLVTAYYYRAEAYKDLKNYAAARADFSRAIQLDPKYPEAYLGRGIVRRDMGDFDGALADCNHASVLMPDNPYVYSTIGSIMLDQCNLDGAMAAFKKATHLNPQAAGAFVGRCQVHKARGEFDDAMDDIDKSIKLNSRLADNFAAKAVLEARLGKTDQALVDLEWGTKLARSKPLHDYSFDYAQLFAWPLRMHQGKQAEADSHLVSYFGRLTDSSAGNWPRILEKFLLGQLSETTVLAEAAKEHIEPEMTQYQSCEAWYYIGEKSLLSGNKQKAIACFQKCVATNKQVEDEYMMAKWELQSLVP